MRFKESQLNDTGNYTVRVDAISDTREHVSGSRFKGISQDVTMSTLLLNFLMTWSILGHVLLFTLILLSLIRCYSTRHGGHDLMGKEVRASLLACGIRQASSQIYIAPDSLIGVERYSSSLAIENAPEDVQEYSWHRGANDTEENLIISYNATSHSRRDGPMYSGRESVSVRELEIPQISVNTTSVVDWEDAVAATCYTNDSHIHWYVNYVPVSRNYRMTISPDNKTLVIRMFSRFNSPLQCGIEILPERIQKSDLVYVTVAHGPYSLQLSSSPTDFGGILSAEIGSQVEMECISYSRPESKYRWMHNGSFLSFSEKNITLPSLTWDQMGRYRCIAENSATQLTLYDEVHVQAPWRWPVVSRTFTISGSLLMFLIIFTVLGFTHFLMVLIRALFRHYST
ncbi:PREDICTED: carcinoembryonic antigen-related cell adhesion molecule 18, partial [Capra hircus]|uniref:carcinoembryonic antigen-related cell adhesion molecule 18 n=1 Tax=Capra hircus TaxID=9925 RepID=UPI000846871F